LKVLLIFNSKGGIIISDIENNIRNIRQIIERSKMKSPYGAKEVLLLAVTKTVDPDRINDALDQGITAIGENRVQEILRKFDQVKHPVQWHLIGHLQTNKVKYIIDKVSLIHSLDSISLAEEIEKRAQIAGIRIPVLVQVNVAGEETKYGVEPKKTVDFVREIASFQHLWVKGLMTIGPLVEDAEENRPVFRRLRELRDEIHKMAIDGVDMDYLSMGMTNDYHIAVEEGANIVRIGSAIFGRRVNK
jgi:pyridoxal phosphate enzyme (YggS family)